MASPVSVVPTTPRLAVERGGAVTTSSRRLHVRGGRAETSRTAGHVDLQADIDSLTEQQAWLQDAHARWDARREQREAEAHAKAQTYRAELQLYIADRNASIERRAGYRRRARRAEWLAEEREALASFVAACERHCQEKLERELAAIAFQPVPVCPDVRREVRISEHPHGADGVWVRGFDGDGREVLGFYILGDIEAQSLVIDQASAMLDAIAPGICRQHPTLTVT